MAKYYFSISKLEYFLSKIQNWVRQNFVDASSLNSAINTEIAKVVGSTPETLNTLEELANALGEDPNFATTVADQIGQKSSVQILTWEATD